MVQLVKWADLFAIPVQLTFRGQRFFYTLFGGVVSIILMTLLAGISIYQLHSQLSNPQYYSQPQRVTFESKDILTSTATNTIAIGVLDLN